MSNSTQSIIEGQGFYRILSEQSYDYSVLYEIDVSARAIVIGSESDFALFDGYYLDSLTPSSIGKFSITPNRPWIAPTNANLAGTYNPLLADKAGAPGKIFVTPADYQFSNPPPGFQFLLEPKVDLIVYTGSLPNILPNRTNKIFRGPLQLFGSTKKWLIPFYGRRYLTLSIVILDYVGDFDFSIDGIRKYLPIGTATAGSFETVNLVPTTNLNSAGPTTRFSITYDALETGNDKGYFDMISLTTENANPAMDPSAFTNLGVQFSVEVSD